MRIEFDIKESDDNIVRPIFQKKFQGLNYHGCEQLQKQIIWFQKAEICDLKSIDMAIHIKSLVAIINTWMSVTGQAGKRSWLFDDLK